MRLIGLVINWFYNEQKPMDQNFKDNDVKVVKIKSFYIWSTPLAFLTG